MAANAEIELGKQRIRQYIDELVSRYCIKSCIKYTCYSNENVVFGYQSIHYEEPFNPTQNYKLSIDFL